MDFQMQELIDDYQQFCYDSGLLPSFRYKMRALACGSSLSENINFGLYYAPNQKHDYIGFYDKKSIKGIGKLVNIVTADLLDEKLNVFESENPLLETEKERIIGAIKMAYDTKGWDITKGQKFFIADKFPETNFRKITKFPLQGSKFFDLKQVLNIENIPCTDKIASLLKEKTW